MTLLWIKENVGPAERTIGRVAGTCPPNNRAPVVRRADYRHLVVRHVTALILCFAAGAIEPASAAGSAANVDSARITGADQDPANWMTYGRTYSEQRFSPLARITADNVKKLGLAWYTDLDTNRGQEATPLVIDGVLYVSTAWSMVKAFDAMTGTLLWSYDPAVPPVLGVRGCCDVVNRGVAAWKGKIFVATFDGRLEALDAQTGKPVWSVMTVDPSKPYTITQAPRVIKERVVIGNSGSGYRSASQGDNWFLSSIVAIDADNGNYVWHYQATPGEEWDYDAVQQLILADLTIDGVRRQVLMQANKNGFFYVLDRMTGELISAKNFTPVTWASGVDQKTGRPIENPDIRYDKTGKPAHLLPGALGAHSWQAMAFNPRTGLVYIPAQEIPMAYVSERDFKPAPMGWNIGVATTNMPNVKGYLIAWDPVNQREVWRANYLGPWNGGVLTTASDLVVQGNAAGDFSAYRASTGEKLWSMFAQSPVMAAPVTYEINGEHGPVSLLGRFRPVLARCGPGGLANAHAQPSTSSTPGSEYLLPVGHTARDGNGLRRHHVLRHGFRLCSDGDELGPPDSRRLGSVDWLCYLPDRHCDGCRRRTFR
jgi:quinohemoprotein ethanol dehydrogenase